MSIIGTRQAAEFDFALERNGGTATDVKKMSEGSTLAKLLMVVRGLAEVVPVVKAVLKVVDTIIVSAQPKFVAKDHIPLSRRGMAYDDDLPLFLDKEFIEQFYELVEDSVPATRLTSRRLSQEYRFNYDTQSYPEVCNGRSLPQEQILSEVPDDKVETTLSQLWALILCQPKGQEGVLQTCNPNVFYIRDVEGVRREVIVHWDNGEHWDIDSRSAYGRSMVHENRLIFTKA